MYFDAIEILLTVIYLITLFYTIFWLLLILEEEPIRTVQIKHWPFVTVAVPAYNEQEAIAKSMGSLLELDYPSDKIQIIVINDGSTDKTLQIAKEIRDANQSRNIMVIDQQNLGKFQALNNALTHATGEFFICLDADSMAEPSAIRKMLPHFHSEKTAVVIPMMKVANPKTFIQKIQWYEYIINKFYNKLLSRLNCLHVAPGPFSMYRKSVLLNVGGFRHGHNTEDLEIALRLQEKGYELVQIRDAQVTTMSPKSFSELYSQRNRWNKGSFLNVIDYRKLLFNRKYGDFGMFYLPLVMVSGFIVATLVVVSIYFSFLKPWYKTYINMSLVNFDIMTYIRSMKFSWNWLDLNYYKIVVMICVLAITAIVVVLSHKFAREQVTKQGILPLAATVMLYYVLLGLFWLGVFKDLILKRINRW